MFVLYKKDKIISHFKCWEDVVDFVEGLKRLNPNEIDRRQFKVKCNTDSIKIWSRK